MSLEFQEAYKRLDKLCKDCFFSNEGVSEYLRFMEREDRAGRRYVSTWDADYRMLKHVRWVRNQLSHEVGTLQSDLCTQDDLKFVESFHDRILKCTDPSSVLRKEREKARQQGLARLQASRENLPPEDPVNTDTVGENKSFFQKIWEKIKEFFS